VGFLAGAIVSGRLAARTGIGRAIVVGEAVGALGALAIPLAPRQAAVPLLVAGMAVSTFGGTVYNVNQVSLRQAITPARLHGRMNATMRFMVWGTLPLGSLLGGALGTAIGLRPTLWVGAAGGLVAVLVAVTYGIQPYGGHTMGWTRPLVLGLLGGGLALLALFLAVERRVAEPLFHLDLFGIRAFAAGNLAGLLASIGRGGLQFMLILWLQGIWLPLHGYSFASTPLWAGIYMVPLTLGFLVAGPVSGWLSDRHGARPFATGGMLLTAASFAALMLLPVDFPYLVFAALLLANGIGSGLFAAPNSAAIMNSVPAPQRGAASGMRATFQNVGFVVSIGSFFSLLIAGLAARLPATMTAGLTANGVPAATADRVAHLPPVGSLFAAFLGENPMRVLLGPAALGRLRPEQAASLTGRGFFPELIAGPFKHGLVIVFLAALAMSLVAAAASWLRGGRYVHRDAGEA
jgi:MFS family permease